MKILLSGGTGLLGAEVAKELAKAGHDLILLTRSVENTAIKAEFRAEYIAWSELRESKSRLFDVSTFIHLAGENIAGRRWSEKRKKSLIDSRVKTAEQAVAALRDANAPIKTVLTASAIGIYGSRGDEFLTESAPPASDFTARLCVEWEAATRGKFSGAKWVALRTAPVLVRNAGFLGKVEPMFRYFGASNLASGRQFFSWIHIRDYVRLVLFALSDPVIEGPLNVTAEKPVRNSAFTSLLGKYLGSFRNFPVPQAALRLAYGELADLLLASQRVIPEKALNAGFRFDFPNLESALSNLYVKAR